MGFDWELKYHSSVDFCSSQLIYFPNEKNITSRSQGLAFIKRLRASGTGKQLVRKIWLFY